MHDHGIIVIDKPRGMTSFDVIRKIRRLYGVKKIGHAGTLDPQAEGILVILLGRATKLSASFMEKEKEYIAWMRLGVKTDTADREGTVIEQKNVPRLSWERIHDVLQSFKGHRDQIPPMYSALKKEGKRYYQYALRNRVFERKARPIFIQTLELLDVAFPYVLFKVVCSRGTYIRTLCEDIAEQLGTVGMLSALMRTRSGCFHLSQAVSLFDLEYYTLDSLLFTFPTVERDKEVFSYGKEEVV